MAEDQLERLVEVVARLRSPVNGCPWDSVQTNMSIRRYLIEEAGEYLDALEAGDYDAVRDELGDILLQVVLNAQIAQDEGHFNIQDVARHEADKMIRRHPHVFGTSSASTEDELRRQWEDIKRTEKECAERKSAMDGVSRSVPALARAQKMLSRARGAGFEWPCFEDALAKVAEELGEVRQALANGDEAGVAAELGDLLFAIVKVCAWRDLHAEELLQAACAKFERRFRFVEARVPKNASGVLNCDIGHLLELWKEAKAAETPQ